jgi:peptidoglycan/xylan/chitin deacetylase (PgdA/CDA1 family)
MLKKGWYILNYHDINWECGPINSSIGGTFSPEMFYDHIKHLENGFEFVSVKKGLTKLSNNKINHPLLSIWFDDGMCGVRKYAFDILDSFAIKGVMSINSNFLLRKEMFWRFKLSYIASTDGMKVLRSRLKKYGYTIKDSVKKFTLDNFSKEILKEIDLTYEQFSPKYFREDSFRIFDTIDGIDFLLKNNWEIANHSASHYPVTEESSITIMEDEFLKCDEAIKNLFNMKTPYWVAPFDRTHKRADKLFEKFNNLNESTKYLVMVGNKINYSITDNIIYRFTVPNCNGKDLLSYLKKF